MSPAPRLCRQPRAAPKAHASGPLVMLGMLAPAAAVVLLLAAGHALALPPEDPSSRPPLRNLPPPEAHPREPLYVGEHIGPTIGVRGPGADTPVLIAARISTLLQIVDAEAGLAVGGAPAEVYTRVNVHPLFIALVWRNIWGVLAAGMHGYAGVGAGRYDVRGTGHWGLPLSLGVGLDLPLMSLERRDGLWVTGRAGWRWLSVAGQDFGGAQAEVMVGWRWYDALR